MTFSEMFSDPFTSSIIIKALIVGVLVSLCSSVLGVSLVLKRYSMIGDGLSHVGFCALAIATLLKLGNVNTMYISIPLVIAAAFLLLRLSDSGKLKGDAAIAVISTGSVAVGYIIYNLSSGSYGDVCSSLFGSSSVMTLTTGELMISIVLSLSVLILYVLFYTRIFAVTFDEPFSGATGINTGLCKLLISILTAVVIVIGMELMGAIMISAIVVFPVLTSMRLCKSFKGVVICSACVSAVCFVTGFFTSCRIVMPQGSQSSLPAGPCVVAVNIVLLIIFSFIEILRRSRKKQDTKS